MGSDHHPTLSAPAPEQLLEQLQDLMESGPGTEPGQTLELFLRETCRIRFTLPGSETGAVCARSRETGLAVRRFHLQPGQAGFATVNVCDLEHYLSAFRRADQDLVPVSPGLEPAGPLPEGLNADTDDGLAPAPREQDLSRWLKEAVEEVQKTAGRITPVRVEAAWVEAGGTAEALVNSRGLQAVRSRNRVWAAMQVVSEGGGELFHRPRLLVPQSVGSLPAVEPVLERLQAFPYYHREIGADPGEPLLFLPEAAAALIQLVAWRMHGPESRIGEPVGAGWRLKDDPHRAGMPFGGQVDDTGRPAREQELADGSLSCGKLGAEGHGWRRSFRDPPERLFSNLVVQGTGEPRPDRGFLVAELRLLPLSPDRMLAVAQGNRLEDGAPAEGGRIRFTFNPARIPARIVGSCGAARHTALGISTPDLVLDPGELNMLP